MTAAIAALNLLLGLAYCGIGVMTVVEMRRDRATFGFSHFGLALICMAFTCGPHHLAHALHLGLEGRHGGVLDLVAVTVGLPVGVIWLLLRVEAFTGGRGDRFIPSTPRWLAVAAVGGAVYGTVITASIADVVLSSRRSGGIEPVVGANIMLVVIYMAIGWWVLRTQLGNRSTLGGWSVSGLSLSALFPTCAVMHAVFAAYALAGRYHDDMHSRLIDWLSVPAGLYFLWVVRQLYRESLNDWNQGPDEVVAPDYEWDGASGAPSPSPVPSPSKATSSA
ncbi:MAG: hypothetical protein H0W70_06310 [Actinobacteria bacterium]|nr:hypothetical protein [Actinomycetota bacterium]